MFDALQPAPGVSAVRVYNDNMHDVKAANCTFNGIRAPAPGPVVSAEAESPPASALNLMAKEIVIEASQFTNNTAQAGSAIYMIAHRLKDGTWPTMLRIVDCTFQDNFAIYSGAAIALTGSKGMSSEQVIIDNCRFHNNTCDWGGAVFTIGVAQLSVTSTAFTGNVYPLYTEKQRHQPSMRMGCRPGLHLSGLLTLHFLMLKATTTLV